MEKPATHRAGWARLQPIIAAVTLVLLPMFVYTPAMRAGFVWDDHDMLLDNRLIWSSSGLHDIWFTSKQPDYFPLTSTMLWIEWRLWGSNPTGYHVMNVLLHTLSSLLIWRVLRRLKVPGAYVAAALFAVHPVAVASVAWISERKNTLSMLWFALSMLCYLRFDDKPSQKRWYVLSIATYLLALLSKTSVVMMPVVLVVMAWWRQGRIRRADWVRSLPFWALSAVLGLVTVWFQHHRAMGGWDVRPEGWLSRIAAAGWCVWFYLYKALAPIRLSMIYPRWDVNPAHWAAWLPLLGLVMFGALAWRLSRPLLISLGYFVIMLAPVLGLVAMSFHDHSLVADHLQYVALIAPIVMVTGGYVAMSRRLRSGPTMNITASILVIAALSALTWRQAGVFQNTQTLSTHTLRLNRQALAAHLNLGVALAMQHRYQEAVGHYREAIRLRRDYAPTYNSMALALKALGQHDDAIEALRTCLRIAPDNWRANHNLANLLRAAGQTGEATAHDRRAEQRFREILQIHPDDMRAHHELGRMLYDAGNLDGAMVHLRRAAELAPNHPDPHNHLGLLLADLDRDQDAVSQYRRALGASADHVPALNNLALALAAKGDKDQARQLLRHAITVAPDHADAYNSLGTLTSDPREATVYYRRAIALAPDQPRPYANLGVALLRIGDLAGAAEALGTACRRDAQVGAWQRLLGVVLAQQGQLEPAVEHLSMAVNLDADDARAHLGLARVLQQLGRDEDAQRHLEIAAKLNHALIPHP